MVSPKTGAGPARTALVADGSYPGVALALIQSARSRCLLSMFIFDALSPAQPALLDLVEALSDATWRGVDVRVVIGGSRENYRIAATAVSARAILTQSRVSALWLSGAPVTGSHAKFLIADDLCLLGSHNWSPGAFSGHQVQDSVVIDSAGVAGLVHGEFERQWTRAGGVT